VFVSAYLQYWSEFTLQPAAFTINTLKHEL
jgi:hypothetical protein